MPSSLKSKSLYISFALLWLVIFAIYHEALSYGFVFMDHYLTGPFAAQVNRFSLLNTIVNEMAFSPLSQPLLKMNLALAVNSSTTTARSMHLENIIFHGLATSLFYILVLRLVRLVRAKDGSTDSEPTEACDDAPAIALISSLLFACHPLATESVAYISGRGGTLVGICFFVALNLFISALVCRGRGQKFILYTLTFTAVLIGTEFGAEGLAIAPTILALLLFLCPKTISIQQWFKAHWFIFMLALELSVSLPWLGKLGFTNQFGNNFGLAPLPDGLYMASQIKGFSLYFIKNAIAPMSLSVEPSPFASSGWGELETLVGTALIVFLLSSVAFSWRKFFVAFPLAEVLLGALPAILLVRNELSADRRFYISLAGLCLLIGYQLGSRLRKHKAVCLSVSAILMLGLSFLSITHARVWSDDGALWSQALSVNPKSDRVRAMLSLIALKNGKAPESERDAQQISQADPNCQLAELSLGKCYLADRAYDQSIEHLSKALALSKAQTLGSYNESECQSELVRALLAEGSETKALPLIKEVLAFNPDFPEGNYVLGKSAFEKGDWKTAANYFKVVLKYKPEWRECKRLAARAFMQTEMPSNIVQAHKFARQEYSLQPSADFGYLLALSAYDMRRMGDCIKYADEVIQSKNYKASDTQLASSHMLKSLSLKACRRWEEAKSERKIALQLEPKIDSDLKPNMLPYPVEDYELMN